MRRRAADNPYLHKDFHCALNSGIEYLHRYFGADSVRQYLRQFASSFYGPLTEDLKKRGLVALKEYFEKVYQLEGGKAHFDFFEDELKITVNACPAVTHLRKNSYPIAELFFETTRTVNETICEGTFFAAELLDYNPETGSGIQRFTRLRPLKRATAGAARKKTCEGGICKTDAGNTWLSCTGVHALAGEAGDETR